MSLRPEHTAPPEIFYNESEALKYTQNSRIAAIQVPSPRCLCPPHGGLRAFVYFTFLRTPVD